jgi:hypothetical protein
MLRPICAIGWYILRHKPMLGGSNPPAPSIQTFLLGRSERWPSGKAPGFQPEVGAVVDCGRPATVSRGFDPLSLR